MKLGYPIARRFSSYTSVNFKDSKKAYQLLDNKSLKRQRNIYSMFKVFSKNERVGQSIITKFMDFKPPIIYPYIQNMLFDQFCGGEDIESVKPLMKKIAGKRISPMLNYGVENSMLESDLDSCKDEMINMIDTLKVQPELIRGKAVLKVTGIISYKRLKKIQDAIILNNKERREWKKDILRLEEVCEHATTNNVKLIFDAETNDVQRIIHSLSLQMMRKHNKQLPNIYGTIQFYRKDSHQQLDNLIKESQAWGYVPGVKLVRGAYIYDEILANNRELLHDTKEDTDVSYNTAVTKCLQNINNMAVCFAGHNMESVQHILREMHRFSIPDYCENITLAQMLGMRNDITFNLEGVNVSQFISYGKKKHLVSFLVRRGIENSSSLSGANDELELTLKEIKRRRSESFKSLM